MRSLKYVFLPVLSLALAVTPAFPRTARMPPPSSLPPSPTAT